MTFKNNKIINDYSQYILSRFGERVQKITVDAGFTCPNRDGKISFGGCTYCNNKKFNPGREKLGETVTQQIQTQVDRIKLRYKNTKKYIVYFQAYSNTYASIEFLKKIYLEALEFPNVIGLTIGTRPDCINKEILDFLEVLAKDHYITIEYGLESISDKTLKLINRGHDYRCFKEAVTLSSNRGIHICAHLIIGFPWETQDDILNTAIELSKLNITYLKIHQLQIVKNTKMGNDFLKKPFKLISKNEFLELMSLFLTFLSPSIIIQRVAGDCPESLLIATGWKETAAEIKHELVMHMVDKNQFQGMSLIKKF